MELMRGGASTWPWGTWVCPPLSSLSWTLEWREGGDLVGLLPEAIRGCSSALHGKEKRPVKAWRKPRRWQCLERVQRSGRGWEGTSHCYCCWADPGGAGVWDPLLTQLDQIGVGWAWALLTCLGCHFTCIPASGCQARLQEGGTGEGCRGLLPAPGLSRKALS